MSDDEESFHSADEGDEPTTNKVLRQSKKSPTVAEPVNVETKVPDAQGEPEVVDLQAKPERIEESVSDTLSSPPKLETSFPSDWNVDGWGEQDDDDVMMTPASDRPTKSFPDVSSKTVDGDSKEYFDDLAKKRQQVLDKLTFGGDEKLDKPTSLWGGFNSWLTVASDSINNLTTSVGKR